MLVISEYEDRNQYLTSTIFSILSVRADACKDGVVFRNSPSDGSAVMNSPSLVPIHRRKDQPSHLADEWKHKEGYGRIRRSGNVIEPRWNCMEQYRILVEYVRMSEKVLELSHHSYQIYKYTTVVYIRRA